jgi:hypothetical protein
VGQWSDVAGWVEGGCQSMGKWHSAGGYKVGFMHVVL